jgi:hypothetical protein
METSALSVEKGMDVYSADGEQLGTVDEVWAESKTHGTLERSTTQVSDYGPISGNAPALDTSLGYFRVAHGGIAGIGEKSMLVPLSEVESADRDSGVRLRCIADVCHQQYEETPDSFRHSQ